MEYAGCDWLTGYVEYQQINLMQGVIGYEVHNVMLRYAEVQTKRGKERMKYAGFDA